jgi:hypothetical protein
MLVASQNAFFKARSATYKNNKVISYSYRISSSSYRFLSMIEAKKVKRE